jgi:large subunit ribosomal protein L19
MSLFIKHQESSFGVGDKVRVVQKIKEGEKERSSTFEGLVIAIKGVSGGKTFTVRRIGEARVGIEKVFPVDSPTIEKVEVLKHGTTGVKRAKLYYLREKPSSAQEEIFSRAHLKTKKK